MLLKEKKNRRMLSYIVLLLLTVFLTMHFGLSAYAAGESAVMETMVTEPETYVEVSSWRPSDSSIYAYTESEGEAPTGSVVSGILGGLTSLIGGLAEGLLSVLIAPLLTLIGNILYSILLGAGISMDGIIYGRVGGASALTENVALYTFELQKGNIYGTIAMYAYNILMSIFTVILIVVILYRLVALLYSGSDGKSRAAMKEILIKSVIVLAAMYVMPKAIDLLLYVRDIILYTIRTGGVSSIESITGASADMSDIFGFGTHSLVTIYSKAATFNIVNAAIFLAVCVYVLYLAANYISIALTFAIMLVIFPLVCVTEVAFNNHRIRDWFMEVLALAMIPVIDSILLLFPLILMLVVDDSTETVGAFTLIRFVMVMSIIPARNFARERIGLGRASAMEGVGVGAALGAIQLGRSLARGISKINSNVSEKEEEAATEEDLAVVDNQTIAQNDASGKEKVSKLQQSINERLESGKSEKMNSDGSETMADVDGYEAKDYGALTKEMEEKGVSTTQKNARLYQEGKADMVNMDNAVSRLNERKRENLDKIAALKNSNKVISDKMKDAKNPGEKTGLRAQLSQNEQQIQALESENRAIDGRTKEFRTAQKGLSQTLSEFEKMGANVDPEKMQAFDNQATIANFERPEILKNISAERRAELREEKSKMLRSQARTRMLAGYSSMTTGAIVGGSSAMFLGSSAMSFAGAAGMDIGGVLSDNSLSEQEFRQAQTGRYATGIAGSVIDSFRSGSGGVVNQAVIGAGTAIGKMSGVPISFHADPSSAMVDMYDPEIELSYGNAPIIQPFIPSYSQAEYGSGRDYAINPELMDRFNSFSPQQNEFAARYASFAPEKRERLVTVASALVSSACGRIDSQMVEGKYSCDIDSIAADVAKSYYEELVSEGALQSNDWNYPEEVEMLADVNKEDYEEAKADYRQQWEEQYREYILGNVQMTAAAALKSYAEHIMPPERAESVAYEIYGNVADRQFEG